MGVFENALLIPLSQLKGKIDIVVDLVNKHPEASVVVHCKTGMRARVGASILTHHLNCQVTVLNEVIDKIGEKGVKLTPYKGN